MPIGIGLAVGGAATLGAGALQAGAAGSAAKSAAQSQANTLAWEKQVYGNQSAQVAPDIAEGNAAGSELAGLLGTGGNPAAATSAFNTYLGSTNYQFELGQGENAIEYANAPAFSSGATAKALDTYAAGTAGNALTGYEALLSGQQTLGVNAASALGSTGVGAGSTIGSANTAAAQQTGAAALSGANSLTSALQGITTLSNEGLTASSFNPNAFGGGLSSQLNAPIYGTAVDSGTGIQVV